MKRLTDKHGRCWSWDPARKAYGTDLGEGVVLYSRRAIETMFGPVEEGEDPSLQLATDFIDAARLTQAGHVDGAIETLMPLGLRDAEAHLRIHLLAATGALLAGGAARQRFGGPPEDGSFYSFELTDEGPNPEPLPADKVLAARLMTLGANLDQDVIRDLVTASCSVGGDGCALLTQAVMELVSLFGALNGPNEEATV
jgi:hypothetical protein